VVSGSALRYGPGLWAGSLPDLTRERVRSILFVSSLYESFMLAEDGLLNEVMQTKFMDLHLVQAPGLTQAASAAEALELLAAEHSFDLVITGLQVGDMDAVRLARRVREVAPDVPVMLLAHDYSALKSLRLRPGTQHLDGLFLWEGDARVLVAMVKLIEDRRNLAHDAAVGVPIFLVVEDSIRHYSSFLPVIYTEMMRYVEEVTSQGVSVSQRMLRFRGRPKILLAMTYEEAWHQFMSYPDNVLGVISDVDFPRGGVADPGAGVELARSIHALRPDIPIALHSSHPANAALADSLGCAFLWKRSTDLLHQLRVQLAELFAFGPFTFRLPDGEEVGKAHDLDLLVAGIRSVPIDCVIHHAERNDFSRWLCVRAEFELARLLRPRRPSDFATPEQLRDNLVSTIEEYRRQRFRGTVTDFDPARFPTTEGVSRIGSGSLGGKARGLAFAARLLDRSGIRHRFPGVRVAIPPSTVLGTDVFEAFLNDNELRQVALESNDDAERERRFVAAHFPEEVTALLANLVEAADYPLAVRSSSLLEDSPFQSFAGVFDTLMLPNVAPRPQRRLQELQSAIARVYASAFSSRVSRIIDATPYRVEEMQMAVVIQKVVGRRRRNLFYPDISGVARSLNFYPVPPAKPNDGVVAVALGFGRTVVEGERCLRFSPAHPNRPAGFGSLAEVLDNAQREFWALRLDSPGPRRLVRCGLEVAEADGLLGLLGSTYSPDSDVVTDGIGRPGIRIVSFAGILKHRSFPLADIIRDLLEVCERAVGSPVELEFAVDLSGPPEEPREFAFLQLRPLTPAREQELVDLSGISGDALIARSDSVLGNGRITGIRDVVLVEPGYHASAATETCTQLARFNADLLRRGDPYLLIGPGRWGSTHPQFGIPVVWEDIAGARVIVETTLADRVVAPSQGSHFFQNLAASDTGYFTIGANSASEFLDWSWLLSQPAAAATDGVRHLRLDAPVLVVINGLAREGVIARPSADQG
jgi:CheY-like chemotaxis protein